MEQVYTVKVRCEPSRNQQPYPSERDYSSSTVGGIAAVHLILCLFGALLLLPAFTSSVELGAACILLLSGGLSACLTGIFASKMWYIDRYIRWFLVASCVSVFTTAVSSLLVLTYALRPAWQPFLLYHNLSRPSAEPPTPSPLKEDLYFHIFLASFLEFLLSVQSVKIAAEGVKNTRESLQASPPRTLERDDIKDGDLKPPNYSDVVKELCRLQKNALLAEGSEFGKNIVTSLYAVSEQRLPRPETHKEYKERMENFLSAQFSTNSNSTKD